MSTRPLSTPRPDRQRQQLAWGSGIALFSPLSSRLAARSQHLARRGVRHRAHPAKTSSSNQVPTCLGRPPSSRPATTACRSSPLCEPLCRGRREPIGRGRRERLCRGRREHPGRGRPHWTTTSSGLVGRSTCLLGPATLACRPSPCRHHRCPRRPREAPDSAPAYAPPLPVQLRSSLRPARPRPPGPGSKPSPPKASPPPSQHRRCRPLRLCSPMGAAGSPRAGPAAPETLPASSSAPPHSAPPTLPPRTALPRPAAAASRSRRRPRGRHFRLGPRRRHRTYPAQHHPSSHLAPLGPQPWRARTYPTTARSPGLCPTTRLCPTSSAPPSPRRASRRSGRRRRLARSRTFRSMTWHFRPPRPKPAPRSAEAAASRRPALLLLHQPLPRPSVPKALRHPQRRRHLQPAPRFAEAASSRRPARLLR
mmetsp:Transcript_54399/g.137934  ORF Transcript_54399/g.137934 Transcript_54399/m.137934 type:complete len:423 (-) Transcript_54399:89-1357(-)